MDTAQLYKQLIESTGEDVSRDGLLKTRRAAAAFKFLTQGYTQSLDDVLNEAVFDSDNNEMVIVKDIELYSCASTPAAVCGKVHVAYLPQGKVIACQKSRASPTCSRGVCRFRNSSPPRSPSHPDRHRAAGVGVVIEAQHFCMMMRGVQKQNSWTITSMMLGAFRDHDRTGRVFAVDSKRIR